MVHIKRFNATMLYCSNFLPVLLLHVSLLLALFAGAGLATAARLKWDPSTYILIRELFWTEYYVGATVLCIGTATLVALGHLAAIALMTRPPLRRILFLTYASLMLALIVLEMVWAAWMAKRIVDWLKTDQAADILKLLKFRSKLQPYIQIALRFLSNFHPLPGRINVLIQEAEDDVPSNLYVAIAAVILVGTLEVTTVVMTLYIGMRSKQARSQHCSVKRQRYLLPA